MIVVLPVATTQETCMLAGPRPVFLTPTSNDWILDRAAECSLDIGKLLAFFPDISLHEVAENTGFDLHCVR